jgi:hypothetical protein
MALGAMSDVWYRSYMPSPTAGYHLAKSHEKVCSLVSSLTSLLTAAPSSEFAQEEIRERVFGRRRLTPAVCGHHLPDRFCRFSQFARYLVCPLRYHCTSKSLVYAFAFCSLSSCRVDNIIRSSSHVVIALSHLLWPRCLYRFVVLQILLSQNLDCNNLRVISTAWKIRKPDREPARCLKSDESDLP